MEFERSFTVAADAERVWQFLQDADKVAACVPDLELATDGEQGRAAVTMRIAFDGPPLTYAGSAGVAALDEANRRIAVEGKGVARFTGSAILTATLSLEPLADATRVELVGMLELTGKPSRLDPQLVHTSVASIVDRTVAVLADALGGEVSTESVADLWPAPSVQPEPPLAEERAGTGPQRRRPKPGPPHVPTPGVLHGAEPDSGTEAQLPSPAEPLEPLEPLLAGVPGDVPTVSTVPPSLRPTGGSAAPAPAQRFAPAAVAILFVLFLLRRRRRRRGRGAGG